jgi:hypothetical protein
VFGRCHARQSNVRLPVSENWIGKVDSYVVDSLALCFVDCPGEGEVNWKLTAVLFDGGRGQLVKGQVSPA